MHDSTIHYDLITSLILEDINKISIVINLEINNKIKELKDELRIITSRNKLLRRPNKIECNSVKEEIDLRRQTKKKIDNTGELQEEVKGCKFKIVKKLQDLNYAKNDEIVETAKI